MYKTYIDTHAHIDDKVYDNEGLEVIISKARNARVRYIIVPGTDLASSGRIYKIVDNYDNLFFAVGVHPHESKTFSYKDIEDYKKMLKHKKAVAIGEIGLDYHYSFSNEEEQKKALVHFLDLAAELDKPVILHCRKAEKDLYELIKEYSGTLRGVIHCFSGNADWAARFLDLGFYLGFTGVITFDKAGELINILKDVPIDRILSETDSPYLAPVPHRGKKNEPALIPIIVEKIAEVKGKNIEEIAPILLDNAAKCFNLTSVIYQDLK